MGAGCSEIGINENEEDRPGAKDNPASSVPKERPSHSAIYPKKANLIWIDKNVENEENKFYLDELEKTERFKIRPVIDVNTGINIIKEKKFEDTYIILSGFFYKEFILKFQENLKDIYCIPKIIIFTGSKNKFIEFNSDIKDFINDEYYNLGKIQTFFDEIYEFLLNSSWKKEIEVEKINFDLKIGKELSFEYIESIEDLYLPTYYKSLIKLDRNENFDVITQFFFNEYSNNKLINELLSPIIGLKKIPYELLCKYYARLITLESKFFKNMNKMLRQEKIEGVPGEFLSHRIYPYIKLLFEGLKIGCLNSTFDGTLYRAQYLEINEIELIKKYLNKKKEGIPASICFSKAFLSFSTDMKVALGFLKNKPKNENQQLFPILFILKKKDNFEQSLSTYINLENITYYKKEKEILFLPFSSFEIISIEDKEHKIYEIELSYLGKYSRELESINIEKKIPDSPFKKYLTDSPLMEREEVERITNVTLVNEFHLYKEIFNTNNDIKEEIFEIPKKEEDCIIYNVKEEDIDSDGNVQIIGENKFTDDFVKINKNKVSLIINGEQVELCYKYKLQLGENKIKFVFKEEIKSYNSLFSGCTSLSDISVLKDWDVSKGTDFKYLFKGCKSLSNVSALSNWDVSNGIYFSSLFEDCSSLSDISALKNWNVSKGTNFISFFKGCSSLKDISALKDWNMNKCISFIYLFKGCKSLEDISSLKNWNVSSGVNFSSLFHDCICLSDISSIKNWNVSSGTHFASMFNNCSSLKDISPLINWDVSKGIDFNNLFNSCKSLRNINGLEKWNVSNGTNFSSIFKDCIFLSDISSLRNWNVFRGTNFSSLFENCSSLSDISPLQKWELNRGINFNSLFKGCKSLESISPLKDWNLSSGVNLDYLFKDCISLSNVSVVKNWNITSEINLKSLFQGCPINKNNNIFFI